MTKMEEKVEVIIKDINTLHEAVGRINWATLNRESFIFELEQNTKRIKELYLKLEEINRELKLLLEKNTPSLDELLVEYSREIIILDSNIALEKKKKIRQTLINEKEKIEVPELYSSLQQKILSISLKSRYQIDRVKNFLTARKMPFVKKGSTAKQLLEALEMKENEINELKQKIVEIKHKTFFGNLPEKSIAEIESEAHEIDKKFSILLDETQKSLKTHFAQINYVEGSFIHLKEKVEKIEEIHKEFSTKTLELIKELKKERDYAKKLALEIEEETIHKRNEYTRRLLELEEKKQAIEEKLTEKFEKEIATLKRIQEEKGLALKNSQKLIEQMENEIRNLKKQEGKINIEINKNHA